MNRFDRILGILLFLRSGKLVSAADLAKRFEVSTRTIYRDIETLNGLGVPVYGERGREGGFQLLEGYFLPPLMFSTNEAVVLLLGLIFLHSSRVKPFEAELETAEQKLLAVMPNRLQAILAKGQKIIGFENSVDDAFHPEPATPPSLDISATEEPDEFPEKRVVSLFLQAILEGRAISLQYHSPYRARSKEFVAEPFGMFWDRDRWYLVGEWAGQEKSLRFWRADRVRNIKPAGMKPSVQSTFDVQKLLGHRWLKSAVEKWSEEAPVKIRLTPAQAERLQQDWYYRHAKFEHIAKNQVLMTIGEDNCQVVLELLRWLGPGAELVEPQKWRHLIRDELRQMLTTYTINDNSFGSG
jgi:predicted DNA-binding transcriptional regulator YafY